MTPLGTVRTINGTPAILLLDTRTALRSWYEAGSDWRVVAHEDRRWAA